jgi:hypothetical protein
VTRYSQFKACLQARLEIREVSYYDMVNLRFIHMVSYDNSDHVYS